MGGSPQIGLSSSCWSCQLVYRICYAILEVGLICLHGLHNPGLTRLAVLIHDSCGVEEEVAFERTGWLLTRAVSVPLRA